MESNSKNIVKSISRFGKDHLFNLKYLLTYNRNNASYLLSKPQAPFNSVLQDKQEINEAINIIKSLNLIKHPVDIKNWDSLGMFSIIIKNTTNKDPILDAGGDFRSTILHWLRYLDYKYLVCLNLDIQKRLSMDKLYEKGDITNTNYKDNIFGAITCQNVIEHGVDINAYLKEMSRILKPGGLLITSTDYWDKPIDTNKKIFTMKEIIQIIARSSQYGFELVEDVNLFCKDKVVKSNGVDYTYVYFTLRKKNESINDR